MNAFPRSSRPLLSSCHCLFKKPEGHLSCIKYFFFSLGRQEVPQAMRKQCAYKHAVKRKGFFNIARKERRNLDTLFQETDPPPPQ